MTTIALDRVLAFILTAGALCTTFWAFQVRKVRREVSFEQELHFRRLADSNIIGVAVANCECVVESNDYFLDLLQYSRKELKGGALKWNQILPAEYLDAFNRTMNELRVHGASAPTEREYFRKDGSRVPVLVGSSLLSKEPLTRVFFVLDLSEGKETVRTLQESEARFRSIFNEAAVGMVVTMPDGRYAQVNSAFCDLLGYSEEELRAMPYEAFTHPDDIEDTGSELRRRLLAGELPRFRTEKRYIHKSGRVVWVLLSVSVVRDSENQPLYFIAQMQDITQRKCIEEDIRVLNDALEVKVAQRTSELIALNRELTMEMATCRKLKKAILDVTEQERNRIGQDLHDDLGQQLTGLSLLAKVLEKRLSNESHPEAVNAGELGRSLSMTVGSVRDLAKGLYPVELEREGLIRALRELAHRTEKHSLLSCQFNHDDDFRFEPSAATHLYRIVQEAVNNATKHAAASNIFIECTSSDGLSVLSVTNDGKEFEEPEVGLRGIGLDLMRYRAGVIGAQLEIRKNEGGGCAVICRLDKVC